MARSPGDRAETEKEMPAVVSPHPNEDELLALSEGDATPAERKRLVAHLDGCVSCRALLAAFSATDEDPLVGQTVGGYVVEAFVSKGAMGAVYLARGPHAAAPVALKLALPSLEADAFVTLARMRAEARALAALSHPNVVGVFGFGELPDGRPYLVMEYLEGETLSERLRRKPPSARQALEWLEQLLSGLEACHHNQVVHRDLKPSNVLLVRDEVKLIDFGLARHDDATAITSPESLMGSVGYLAPELMEGVQATVASDLYAVGCIAWLMLTGGPVFPSAGRNPLQVLRAHVKQAPPNLRDVLEDASPALEAWVASLLERDPAKRCASTGEARQGLEQARRALDATVIERVPVSRRPTKNDRPRVHKK